ncbi:hypothetical protein CRE_00089 [Caenorhabditis remanei]|uniref:Uncharacterized protein n=1 Tax=Caenorhabditis remanei TaxID=31234 RepID=E3LD39_CAERE|nr:hypothetical protein CRE_00089 [Caenorhabditis remanei]
MANLPAKKKTEQGGKKAEKAKPGDQVFWRRGQEPKTTKQEKRSKSLPAPKPPKKDKKQKNNRQLNEEECIELFQTLGLN